MASWQLYEREIRIVILQARTKSGREHCKIRKNRPKEQAVNFTPNLNVNRSNYCKDTQTHLRDIKGVRLRHETTQTKTATCRIIPTDDPT